MAFLKCCVLLTVAILVHGVRDHEYFRLNNYQDLADQYKMASEWKRSDSVLEDISTGTKPIKDIPPDFEGQTTGEPLDLNITKKEINKMKFQKIDLKDLWRAMRDFGPAVIILGVDKN